MGIHVVAVFVILCLGRMQLCGDEIWAPEKVDDLVDQIRKDRSRIRSAEIQIDLVKDSADAATETQQVMIWWQADGNRERVDTIIDRPGSAQVIETRSREVTELLSGPIGYLRFHSDGVSRGQPSFQLAPRDITATDVSRSSGFLVPDIRLLGLIASDVDGLRYRLFEGNRAERLVAMPNAVEVRVESVMLGEIPCLKMESASSKAVRGQMQDLRRIAWISTDPSVNLIRRIEQEGDIVFPDGSTSQPRSVIEVEYSRHEATDIMFPGQYTYERFVDGQFRDREIAMIRVVRMNEDFPDDPFSLKAIEQLPTGAVGYGTTEALQWDGSNLKKFVPPMAAAPGSKRPELRQIRPFVLILTAIVLGITVFVLRRRFARVTDSAEPL